MLGVARPTRGIEFTESRSSIERNLVGVPYVVGPSWDKPIPDSFNYVSALLLEHQEVDRIWFVEEDVVVPEGGFSALLALDVDIAHIYYDLKLGQKNPSYRYDKDGKILWVGFGCTLIKRTVFERLARPWFRVGYAVGSVHEGSSCKKKILQLVTVKAGYGTQDIYFCWMAREAGFHIAVVENMKADHLVLEGLGAPLTNDGCHKIRRVLDRGEDYRGRIAKVGVRA